MKPIYKKEFLSRSEYQVVADTFNLGVIKRIVFFDSHGFESTKVAVECDSGKFVVSTYKFSNNPASKSKKSLQYEIDLLNIMADLPVPHYILSSNGRFVESFSGRFATVYKFISGNHPKAISPDMACRLGDFLGRFHVRGKKFFKKLRGRRRFYYFAPAILRRMDRYAKMQTSPVLRNAFITVKNGLLKNLLPTNLPAGPIHVDIKPENELFVRNRLNGVLDFGIFYSGPYLIDIGKTVMWNCRRGKRINSVLLRAFMRGYTSRRKLTASERVYLVQSILFGIYAHIYVDLYHVPLRRVPENYTLNLVLTFLPVAAWLEKHRFQLDSLAAKF